MHINTNLPPLTVYVDSLFTTGQEGHMKGRLVSVRAKENQALQFSVLLECGALYTGLPLHAISHKIAPRIDLDVVQPYDAIDGGIELITLELMRNTACSVLLWQGDGSELVTGRYQFTLDFVGDRLARDPIQWKQFHFIALDSGHFCLYPQYRIRFLDAALCPKIKEDLPKFLYNDKLWLGE